VTALTSERFGARARGSALAVRRYGTDRAEAGRHRDRGAVAAGEYERLDEESSPSGSPPSCMSIVDKHLRVG